MMTAQERQVVITSLAVWSSCHLLQVVLSELLGITAVFPSDLLKEGCLLHSLSLGFNSRNNLELLSGFSHQRK
jgi:hypothetical protein